MGFLPNGAVEASARRDIGLAPDDRGEFEIARSVVKFHGAVHDAVVGQCNGGAAVFGGTPAEPVDAAGSVQKRVLTVDMKMNELTHRTVFSTLCFGT